MKTFREYLKEGWYLTEGNVPFRACWRKRNGTQVWLQDRREFDPGDYGPLDLDVPCRPLSDQEVDEYRKGIRKEGFVVTATPANKLFIPFKEQPQAQALQNAWYITEEGVLFEAQWLLSQRRNKRHWVQHLKHAGQEPWHQPLDLDLKCRALTAEEFQQYLKPAKTSLESLRQRETALESELKALQETIKGQLQALRDQRSLDLAKLLTREIVDALVPEHGRTSCSDTDLCNGYAAGAGSTCRCSRCFLLTVLKEKYLDPGYVFEVHVTYDPI